MKEAESLLQKEWVVQTDYSDKHITDRVKSHRPQEIFSAPETLHDPYKLKNMSKAVNRIHQALARKEKIMILGDYDADGITGASVLYMGLISIQQQVFPNQANGVSVRLPHRIRDGYGMNKNMIDDCKKNDVSLLITVDCGSRNIEEIQYANSLGMETIVTDHHQLGDSLPDAFSVINPQQQDCNYPNKTIVGAGVAFKLIQALFNYYQLDGRYLEYFYELVGIATIADCGKLLGENKWFVKECLKRLPRTHHKGLRSLIELKQLHLKPSMSTEDISFQIIPAINASGRVGDPIDAFKMYIGQEAKAQQLFDYNEERRSIQKKMMEEALLLAEKDQSSPITIVWKEDWHPGLTGIVAGRLCEYFSRPAICLTRHNSKSNNYVASARAPEGFNIGKLIEDHSELFIAYGGHEQAAGVTISKSKLDDMKEQLLSAAENYKAPQSPQLILDTEIKIHELNYNTYNLLQQLGPFGTGHPTPCFVLKNVQLSNLKTIGADNNTLSLEINDHRASLKRCIGFSMGKFKPQLEYWTHVDLAFKLNENFFRGKKNIDMHLLDITSHKKAA